MTFPATISQLTVKTGGAILALWAVVATMTTTQVWVFRQATGRPDFPLIRLYIMHLLSWLPWALLAMGLLYLARLRPWRTPRWWTVFLLLPPLGVALTLSKFCLEFGITSVQRGISLNAELFTNTFKVFMATSFPVQLLTAWIVLGAGLIASYTRTPPGGAAELAEPESYARHLTIRSSGRTVLVNVEEIDRIDAADYYSQIHANGDNHLARESLTRLARRLDPGIFVRIHRSTIINIRRIRRLEARPGGDAEAILHDGTRKRVSRSRRKALEQALYRAS